jgi:hypothetical protein
VKHLVTAALLLVACGDDHQTVRDGGPDGDDADVADAEIDADPDVRGTVTVRLLDRAGAPLSGMHAVFIDTDGTVTDQVSDAAGTATASVFPGASVTALREHSSQLTYSLTTVQSLVPGDTITLISAAGAASLSDDPFTQRVVPLPSVDLLTATKSGSTGTFTTRTPHGLAVNDRVFVAGASVAGYNGTWTVASAPSTTSFTANLGGGGLSNAIGGSTVKGELFTVSFPTYGGATSYEVHTRCGPVDVGTSNTPQLVLRAGCTTSTMDVLVFAKTSGTVEAAYAFQPNVAYTPGGSVTISDPWHALPTLSASITNPTPKVTDVTLERFTPYVRGLPQAVASDTTTGSTIPLAMPVATVAPAFMRTIASCPFGASSQCASSSTGVAQQTITERIDGTAAAYALDLGANLLPWISAVYLPLTQTIDVTVTGSGTYDLFEANLRYVRDVSGSQYIFTWRVFGAVAEDVKFPTLPATLPGDPTIRPTDDQSAYQVYLCESDALASYRSAIGNVYEAFALCEANAAPSTKLLSSTKNRLSSWN